MEYTAMIIPFETVCFDEMNKKQAEQYFDWFIRTKGERLKRLQEYIFNDNKEIILNNNPESLIELWKWFEGKIELVKKSEEEMRKEAEGMPGWMKSHILKNPIRFTVNTWVLAYDISVYLGEVVITNNPQIYWGYLTKPKRLHGVNVPRLLGFQGDMSVYLYGRIEVCMWKSVENTNERYLYDVYMKCCDML